MTDPKPPKTKLELRPDESVWEAMARELAGNPDSPASLHIMSTVNQALRPRAQAVEQVVQSMMDQLQEDGEPQRAAVLAAIRCWERECGVPMDPDMVESLQKTARDRQLQSLRQPPKIDSIVSDLPEVRDTGYRLGIHLTGMEGTWHRLWAIMCVTVEFDGDVDSDDGVASVRAQFEQLLGRKLMPAEWGALVAHVRQRFEAVNPKR